MSVKIETKHILCDLFCLEPCNEFYAFFVNHAKLGVSITVYRVLGKELRLSSTDLVHIMIYHESTLMEQLDAYNMFCYDDEIGMDK